MVGGDLPGSRREDSFAVHGHPVSQRGDDGQLFLVRLAAGGQRNVQHEVSVAGDDIDQHIDNFFWRFVLLAEVVMPLADAGVGLPGARGDGVDD